MSSIILQVDNYYSSKIEQFGATPQGVDWNSVESQNLRFEILSKVIFAETKFSILDFGCGFGAMYEFFKTKFVEFSFTGFDISEKMIAAAQAKFPNQNNVTWTTESPSQKNDFVIASGIFNVKLDNDEVCWQSYMLDTLQQMNTLATKGFAFNVLTKYSDKEFMKDYLYYADPLFLFDFCKRHFSKNVALLHDYNLYEFSIIVKK